MGIAKSASTTNATSMARITTATNVCQIHDCVIPAGLFQKVANVGPRLLDEWVSDASVLAKKSGDVSETLERSQNILKWFLW